MAKETINQGLPSPWFETFWHLARESAYGTYRHTQIHTHTHTHHIHNPDGRNLTAKLSLAKGCLPSLSSHLQDQNHRWLEISKCWPCYGNPLWKVIHIPATAKASPPQPLVLILPWYTPPPSPPWKSPYALFFQGEAAQTCQQQVQKGEEAGPSHWAQISLCQPRGRWLPPSKGGREWLRWTLIPSSVQHWKGYFSLGCNMIRFL